MDRRRKTIFASVVILVVLVVGLWGIPIGNKQLAVSELTDEHIGKQVHVNGTVLERFAVWITAQRYYLPLQMVIVMSTSVMQSTSLLTWWKEIMLPSLVNYTPTTPYPQTR